MSAVQYHVGSLLAMIIRKKYSSLLILAVIPAMLAARTIHVPAEAPTIQAGLDSLSNGDTVLVALGTYAEALQARPLHFVLKGDVVPDSGEYPRPIIDPSPLPGSPNVMCLNIHTGAWPVLEDLVFRNGPQMYPHAPYSPGGIYDDGQSTTLSRCVFDSVFWPFYHVRPWSENIVDSLQDCIFRDIQHMGFEQIDHPVIVRNCDFISGNGGTLCAVGPGSIVNLCHFGSNSGVALVALVGRDTEISQCHFGPAPTLGPKFCVILGLDTVGARVHDNLFSDGTVSVCALSAMAYAPQAFLIQNNTFLNITAASDTATCLQAGAYYPFYATFGGTIRNNFFQNCFSQGQVANVVESSGENTWIENRFVETPLNPNGCPTMHLSHGGSGSVLHRNLFVHTGYALNSEVVSVDAELNYWSDPSGPYHVTDNPAGQGDTIVGNVDFTPWYPDTSFLSVPGLGKPLPKEFVFDAYPNPFNSTVRLRLIPNDIQIVKVELFDLLGRKVKEIWHGPLAYQKDVELDASSLASGIYFARVTNSIYTRHLAMQKLVLLR